MKKPISRETKMKTQRALFAACLAAVMLCLSGTAVSPGLAKSQNLVQGPWPAQLGERKLYASEHGFVYAGSESSAEKMGKVIRTTVRDLKKQGVETRTRGLVIVIDTEEDAPFKVEKLLTMLARRGAERGGQQESEKALKSVADGRKKLEELGMNMDFLLAIAPMPIEPNMLPELMDGFPDDVDRQIDWCMVIPTERSIRASMKKLLDAGMRQKKMGLVKRVAVLPLMVLVEHKVVGAMKEAHRDALYEILKAQDDKSTGKDKIESDKHRP